MVPFVRTVNEGAKVLKVLAKNGLSSSSNPNGLKIGMMCELPSNVILAKEFAEIFDFASIGSNDLTQLTLGADRDSGNNYGDERDPAVKKMIQMAIDEWRTAKKPIGICGQAPSDHEGYAEWLSDLGINSMSLNPDSVVDVWRRIGVHNRSPALL
jgi:pyruvate,water dikinase